MTPYRDSDDYEEPTTVRPRRISIGISGIAWALVFAAIAWGIYSFHAYPVDTQDGT